MPIYLGADKLDELYLGANRLDKVYLGTTLVYQRGSSPPTPSSGILFDNGWVTGIEWAGNQLPRQPYTSLGSYSFTNVPSGHMDLTVESRNSYSSVLHNCHVCTASPVRVPASATSLHVQVAFRTSESAGEAMIFGLLPANCPNSMDASNGGQLSTVVPAYNLTEFTMAFESGIANTDLYAVVNLRRNSHCEDPRSAGTLRIYKVWFE